MSNTPYENSYSKWVTMLKGGEVFATGTAGAIIAQTLVIPALSKVAGYDHAYDEGITWLLVVGVAAGWRMFDNWRKNRKGAVA